MPLGNLINRVVGIVIGLPFLGSVAREMTALQPDAAKMTAEFHMLFIVALMALFIGPLGGIAWLLEQIVPRETAAGRSRRAASFSNRLETPPLALANADREALRIGGVVETMLCNLMTASQ